MFFFVCFYFLNNILLIILQNSNKKFRFFFFYIWIWKEMSLIVMKKSVEQRNGAVYSIYVFIYLIYYILNLKYL